jgi:hypothetical protein
VVVHIDAVRRRVVGPRAGRGECRDAGEKTAAPDGEQVAATARSGGDMVIVRAEHVVPPSLVSGAGLRFRGCIWIDERA